LVLALKPGVTEGRGPGGPVQGNGPDCQWAGEEKGIKIWILRLISMFRKIDYREFGGRNNWKKFLENFRKFGKSRMWTWVNLGEGISRLQGISENANMLCHDMQPNVLLIWQNFINVKSGCYTEHANSPQTNVSSSICQFDRMFDVINLLKVENAPRKFTPTNHLLPDLCTWLFKKLTRLN
jgi:hypothetical protein